MEWYLKVVRDNYANFEGRARRQEFWMFALFQIIITMAIYIPTMFIGALLESEVLLMIGSILLILFYLATLIPTIAVSVRRLHDTGKSGWLYLLSLVPFGNIVLFILFVLEGDIGANEYGEDPKAGERF